MDWNLVSTIFGHVVGIGGVIIGIILYLKGKRTKEPCYSINTETLIAGYSSKFKDLEITYKDRQIENLSVSRVTFWNKGRETIQFDDVPAKIPLFISTEGEVEILDAKVLYQSSPSNDFSIRLMDNGKFAPFFFDYMDEGQGAVFQVIHTGTSPFAPNDLRIMGDIKGAKAISYKSTDTTPLWGWGSVVFTLSILWFFTISYFVVGFISGFETIPLPGFFYVIIIFAVVFTVFITRQIIIESKFHAKVPNGLKSYESGKE